MEKTLEEQKKIDADRLVVMNVLSANGDFYSISESFGIKFKEIIFHFCIKHNLKFDEAFEKTMAMTLIDFAGSLNEWEITKYHDIVDAFIDRKGLEEWYAKIV